LLERTSGRVYRLLPTGACRLLESMDIDAYSAARTNLGWFAGIHDGAGREMIALVGTKPSHPHRRIIDSIELSRTHLTAADSGVLTSSVHWPFRWSLHHQSHKDVVGLPFVRDTVIREGQDSVLATNLLGLPTFPLDHGYIQLLTDPTSDLRVLTIYDEEGIRKRAVVINAAIGVLATHPSSRQLLMLRQTNHREIVLYGWRWRNHPQSGDNDGVDQTATVPPHSGSIGGQWSEIGSRTEPHVALLRMRVQSRLASVGMRGVAAASGLRIPDLQP